MAHQPMSSRDGLLWITYNGEVYNFPTLRADLMGKGHVFKSNCDTEVIIYLYQEYGEDCLKYLRGMFAFAIWDKAKSKLFLARDRIGKKPLYYYYDQKTFIFASEIKSILEDPYVQKEINFEGFYDSNIIISRIRKRFTKIFINWNRVTVLPVLEMELQKGNTGMYPLGKNPAKSHIILLKSS